MESEEVEQEIVRRLFWVEKENERLRQTQQQTVRDTAKVVDALEVCMRILVLGGAAKALTSEERNQVRETLARVAVLSENLAELRREGKQETASASATAAPPGGWGRKARINNSSRQSACCEIYL